MFGQSPPVIAGLFGVVALLFTIWWFGSHKRRIAETKAGVQALANMKWRECAGLVLESLHRQGYSEEMSSRQPGDGGTEFLLKRGSERSLLSYKHGTAYRLGEANVRDFANAVQLQAATTGILVTLGSAEAFARDIAKRYGVTLIDGDTLWPQIENYVSPVILETVREQASEEISRKLWVGIGGSLLLTGAFYALLSLFSPASKPVSSVPAQVRSAVAPTATQNFIDPTAVKIAATAKALEAIKNMTPDQLAQRRAEAAKQIAGISSVSSANWSTESTLVMTLNKTSGTDQDLYEESCRILIQYEELRYSRLQFEPPAGSDVPVRWRQCQ